MLNPFSLHYHYSAFLPVLDCLETTREYKQIILHSIVVLNLYISMFDYRRKLVNDYKLCKGYMALRDQLELHLKEVEELEKQYTR